MAPTPRPGSLSSRLNASTTVLVVEDEHDIATFLGAYFKASGYAMVHVDPGSPDDVVAAVDQHRPACVLMDLRLRGFTGLDCYRRLRDHPSGAPSQSAHRLVPVIMVTADTSASARLAALDGGIDAFVTKPFNVKDVFDLVTERVARAALLRDVGHRDTGTGTVTHSYLRSRLADELAMSAGAAGAAGADPAGAPGSPVAFALLRLGSSPEALRPAGPAAGDHVVGTVAARLAASMAQTPGVVIGRTGEDELGLVFPASPSNQPEVLTERLAAAIEAAGAEPALLPGGREVELALRCGLAFHPEDAGEPDALYMAADAALARAVETGAALLRALSSPTWRG